MKKDSTDFDFNIVLDTNLFGKPDNYKFKNTSITVFLDILKGYANIQVYMPSIVKNELKKHIKENVMIDMQNIQSKYIKNKIPKNFFDKIIEKNYADIEKFIIEYQIIVIDCNKYLNIDEVNDWYFSCEKPFEANKEKRKEFPDAMIISAIKNYFQDNEEKVYVISDDNGFREGFESHSNIKTYKQIGDVMHEIFDFGFEDIEKVKKYLYHNETLKDIDLYSFVCPDGNDDIDVYIDNIIINKIDILVNNDKYTTVEITYNLVLEGDMYIADVGSSFYDREDPECSIINYKYTDKLQIENQTIYLSLYKDKDDNYIRCETTLKAEITMEDYLSEMDFVDSF